MTEAINKKFDLLKYKYGNNSIIRVEEMLKMNLSNRHPLQKGAKWIMPGLSRDPWFNSETFPELKKIIKELENISLDIKREINAVLDQNSIKVSGYNHYLVEVPDWDALYLHKDGKYISENKNLVPSTWSFMESYLSDWLCPLLEMHFSILKSGAKIPLHCDLWNFTINLHLGVEIPNGDCGIEVANEIRKWEEGKCLLFDYSFEHKAWNNTDSKRVCLLMDLWHPEVTLPEREALIFFTNEIRSLIA